MQLATVGSRPTAIHQPCMHAPLCKGNCVVAGSCRTKPSPTTTQHAAANTAQHKKLNPHQTPTPPPTTHTKHCKLFKPTCVVAGSCHEAGNCQVSTRAQACVGAHSGVQCSARGLAGKCCCTHRELAGTCTSKQQDKTSNASCAQPASECRMCTHRELAGA